MKVDMNQIMQFLLMCFAVYMIFTICAQCVYMLSDNSENLTAYPSMNGYVPADHYETDYDGIVPANNFNNGMFKGSGGVADRTPDDYTKSLV